MRDQIDVKDLGGTQNWSSILLNLSVALRQQRLTTIKEVVRAVTVIVMSLAMLSASSLRQLDLYFLESHQTIAWSK